MWPTNQDWREVREGTTIYVATNGYHTGIIVPVSAQGLDWSARLGSKSLTDSDLSGQWLLFGWGDRDFYLNTPTWRDVDIRTGVTALFGSGGSLVHIDYLDRPEEAVTIRPVQLSSEEYQRLSGFLVLSFADKNRNPIPGYGRRDAFYEASGRYNLFYTCNSWTAEALATAGVRVAVWTPFSNGVMRWF